LTLIHPNFDAIFLVLFEKLIFSIRIFATQRGLQALGDLAHHPASKESIICPNLIFSPAYPQSPASGVVWLVPI